jgi:DNA-binding Xre family transcriptional regulator
MISFRPLFETLENRNIDYSNGVRVYGIYMDRYSDHYDNIPLSEINDLCEKLDCEVHEIIEYCED